ncbi:MAG: HAD family phosphatase [Ruminococcaceae bacterium]|nr:HAD family phosphatase [Oscillospiraceae bacterium]
MKKFEGMLFCTDLDGTLYGDDKKVSRENLDAIAYFKSEGGLFTFVTGRVPATAGEIYRLVRPNAPYGCFNGGAVYDGDGERYLWQSNLAPGVEELVEMVEREMPDMGIQPNTEKAVYFHKDSPAMEVFRKGCNLPRRLSRLEEIEEPIMKIVFAHLDVEKIPVLAKLLREHPRACDFDFIRSESWLYEILPKGVSKGAALLKMAELLGIAPENTIAVGDFNNDVSMIRAAGIGFAVDNAVAEAKAVADYVTVSNNHHAIAAIVDRLDRGLFAAK